MVRIDVFGGVRASVNGVVLPQFASRPGALLALLVMARAHPVPASDVVEWLWGADAAPSAGNQLQRLVGQVRRHFEPTLPARSAGTVILGSLGGYQLAEGVESDLFDLDRQLPGSQAGPAARAAALRVIGRRAFAGLETLLANYPACVAVERQCVAVAVDALEDIDIDHGTVDLVQAVAARFPFEERLQAGLVRALGASGRRSEALALYQLVRVSLRDELGIDPGPDLQAAHRDVLSQDRTVPGATSGPAQLPRIVGSLVARPEAQRLLDRIADDGVAGAVLVTAISGMGGIGKTALAVAWAHQLAPRFPDGQLYLNLRGFDAQGDVMTTAEALTALLRAVGATAGADPGNEAQSSLLRSRLAGRRYLLLLDNARDADQVRPLLPGDPGCLVVITSRNRLTSLVTREGAVPIQLDRMSDDEARALLARRLGREAVRIDPAATEVVLRACDGLPLALALVATRIALEPRLTLTDIAAELNGTDLTAWSAEVGSEDLRTVFAWSFAGLDQPAIDAFQLLGAHPGQRLSTASLVSLLGQGAPQCARVLRELCDASLLQQVNRHSFGMHDLLRAYARAMPDPTQRVPAAERRLVSHFVHSVRNASATQGLTHSRPAAGLPGGVVPETFDGATTANAWYSAQQDAITAITALAVRCGWFHDAANITLELSSAVARGGESQAQRSHRLYEILVAAGGLESDDAFGDPALLVDVLREITVQSDWVEWFGSVELKQSLLERAERLADAVGDELARAQVLRAVGMIHLMRGDYQKARELWERALAVDLPVGEASAAIRSRTYIGLGNVYNRLGDVPAALEATGQAIASELEWRTESNMLILAYCNRAEALLTVDRVDDALADLKASRAVGAEDSAYWAMILSLQAGAALRIGELALARWSVDEFRRYVLEHAAEDPGQNWGRGVERLQAQIDEVDLSLCGSSTG